MIVEHMVPLGTNDEGGQRRGRLQSHAGRLRKCMYFFVRNLPEWPRATLSGRPMQADGKGFRLDPAVLSEIPAHERCWWKK